MSAEVFHTNLTLTVAFDNDANGIAKDVTIGCSAKVDIQNIDVSGMPNAILNTFVSWFHGTFTNLLGDQICSQVKAGEAQIDQALQDIGSKLVPFLHVPSPPKLLMPPKVREDSLDWSKWTILSMANDILNTKDSKGVMIINDFYKFATNGTGAAGIYDQDMWFNVSKEADLPPELPPIYFTFQNLTLFGIDKQNHVDVMNPMNISEWNAPDYPYNQTVQFSLNVDELGVELGGKLDVIGTARGFKDWHTDFTIKVSVKDATANILAQIGFLEKAFFDLNLGAVLDEDPVACGLSCVDNLFVSMVDVNVKEFEPFHFSGFSDLAPLFEEMNEAFLTIYGTVLLEIVHGAFANMTYLINEKTSEFLNNNTCPKSGSFGPNKYANFDTSENQKIASWVDDLLNKPPLGENSTEIGWNILMNLVTNNGSISIPIPPMDPTVIDFSSIPQLPFETASITPKSVLLEGLNSYDIFSPLKITGNHTVGNTFKMKRWRTKFTVDVSLKRKGEPQPENNRIELILLTKNFALNANFSILVNLIRLATLTVEQLKDCPSVALDSFSANLLDIGLSNLAIDFKCSGDCETVELSLLSSLFLSQKLKDDMGLLGLQIADWFLKAAEGKNVTTIQTAINSKAIENIDICQGIEPPQPKALGAEDALSIILIAIGALLVLIMIAIWQRKLCFDYCFAPMQMTALRKQDTLRGEEVTTDVYSSLSGSMSGFGRLSFVAFTLALEMLWISTNFSNVYIVQANVWTQQFPEAQIKYNIIELGLVSGVKTFFDGGGAALGVCWLLTLGVVPHMTIFLLLLCFIVPLKKEWRQNILAMLCYTTKLCLFPMFLLCFLLASIAIDIQHEAMNLRLITIGEYGAEAAFIASTVLIFFVHYTAHLHEQCFNEKVGELNFPKWYMGSVAVAVMLVASICLFAFGMTQKLIHFDLSGIGAVPLPPDQVSRDVTVLDFLVTKDKSDSDQRALFLMLMFVAYAIFFPLLSMATRLFFVCTQRQWAFLDHLMTLSSGLQCLDLFWIMNVVVAVDVENLTRNLIYNQFPDLCEPVRANLNSDCLVAKGSLANGTWWLLASMVLYSMTSVLMLIARKKIRNRELSHRLLVNSGLTEYEVNEQDGSNTEHTPQHDTYLLN